MRIFASVLLVLSVLFTAPSAYCDQAGASLVVPSPVHFGRLAVEPASSHPGEAARITLKASIEKGWHLYSVVPSVNAGPFTTVFSVQGRGIDAVSAVSESAPIKHFDPNFQTDVAYHEGSATFTVPVLIEKSVKPGAVPFTLNVKYQTCNNKECLPPATVSMAGSLRVDAGAVRSAYAAPAASAPQASSATLPQKAQAAVQTAPQGLGAFMLTAFAAGLLALLTPCVFPLIPVTFGYFTKEASGERKKLTLLAAAYVVGIILSFVALGLIATAILGAAGPNKVASNPWVNLSFGVLFVILAFAFFETFNLTLPSSMQTYAVSLRNKGGLLGVLLMGLAFVFTAFTCTAPFIASVLATAASTASGGDFTRPVLGMTLFAVALSAPFFLIALFPPLLTRLPRSGEWLSRMKAVLGFVELAYAVLYLSKADLVWQAHIFTRPVIFGVWAVISVCGALYLLGALRVNPYGDSSKMTLGRWIGGVVFGLVALYCFYAMTGRPIDKNLAAFVPEADYGLPKGASASNGEVQWLSSYDTALAQAKQQNKPVFIDFTGYTCTNCRWMEQNIFTKPAVRSEIDKMIPVRLYTDGGVDADKNEALQMKIGKAIAQPLYAVVTPAGQVVDVKIGVESDPAVFAKYLDEGFAPAKTSVPPAAAWAPYTPQSYAAAVQAGKPIVIDFTASWCVVCHAIERTVFSQPDVKSKLGGFTTLQADLTNFDAPANAAIEKQFGVKQLPTVVILDPAGKEIPGTRVSSILPASDFLGRLGKAK